MTTTCYKFFKRRVLHRNFSLEGDLVDGLIEGLALDTGHFELQLGREARAIATLHRVKVRDVPR